MAARRAPAAGPPRQAARSPAARRGCARGRGGGASREGAVGAGGSLPAGPSPFAVRAVWRRGRQARGGIWGPQAERRRPVAVPSPFSSLVDALLAELPSTRCFLCLVC